MYLRYQNGSLQVGRRRTGGNQDLRKRVGSSGGGLFGFFSGGDGSANDDIQLSVLQHEIGTLEPLVELFADLAALQTVKDRSERETPWGKMKNFAGYFLSLYCSGKLPYLLLILYFRGTKQEIRSQTVCKTAYITGLQIDVVLCPQFILLFVGFLVFSNVRGFCLTCRNYFQRYQARIRFVYLAYF